MSQSISQWETWYHSSLPFTPAFVADLTVCGNQHGHCSVTVSPTISLCCGSERAACELWLWGKAEAWGAGSACLGDP